MERAVEVDPQFMEMEYPFEWAGAYELPAGEYELEIGHSHGDHQGHDHGHEHDHECGEDCGHNHNELDVVVMPVPSGTGLPTRDPAALTGQETRATTPELAAAINATVLVYSDWEKITQPGETVTAGAQLHRLKLKDEHGKFKVTLPAAGHYLLFTGHDVPTHLRDASGAVVLYGWDKTFRHEHSHDEEVSSVGISLPGELDGKKLNEWISKLLAEKGGDIFRMKGVLVVKGTNKRLVFQGVHMLFDAKFDRPWNATENRTNTLVFIGKNLDRAALTEGFKACFAG